MSQNLESCLLLKQVTKNNEAYITKMPMQRTAENTHQTTIVCNTHSNLHCSNTLNDNPSQNIRRILDHM